MSENRQGKRALARQRSLKHVPQFMLKNCMPGHANSSYKVKGLRSSKDSLLKMKNSSIKSTKSEASLLPDHRKYSPIEESQDLGSLIYNPVGRDFSDFPQPTFGDSGLMPRKYSHINRLAQGLALDFNEDSLTMGMVPTLAVQNANTLKEKLTTIKFKKRRNSNGSQVNSFQSKRMFRVKPDNAMSQQ
jgi:hypothetical protein